MLVCSFQSFRMEWNGSHQIQTLNSNNNITPIHIYAYNRRYSKMDYYYPHGRPENWVRPADTRQEHWWVLPHEDAGECDDYKIMVLYLRIVQSSTPMATMMLESLCLLTTKSSTSRVKSGACGLEPATSLR